MVCMGKTLKLMGFTVVQFNWGSGLLLGKPFSCSVSAVKSIPVSWSSWQCSSSWAGRQQAGGAGSYLLSLIPAPLMFFDLLLTGTTFCRYLVLTFLVLLFCQFFSCNSADSFCLLLIIISSLIFFAIADFVFNSCTLIDFISWNSGDKYMCSM